MQASPGNPLLVELIKNAATIIGALAALVAAVGTIWGRKANKRDIEAARTENVQLTGEVKEIVNGQHAAKDARIADLTAQLEAERVKAARVEASKHYD